MAKQPPSELMIATGDGEVIPMSEYRRRQRERQKALDETRKKPIRAESFDDLLDRIAASPLGDAMRIDILSALTVLWRMHKEGMSLEMETIAVPVKLFLPIGSAIAEKRQWGHELGEQRTADAEVRHAGWLERANTKWEKNPSLSAAEIGRLITKDLKQEGVDDVPAPDTIAKAIRKKRQSRT